MCNKPRPVLVLDLDHTLFHTRHDGKTYPRPGLHYFLEQVSQHYELFVFTMSMREYANRKCLELGITYWIPFTRIYTREDTVCVNGVLKKTFSRILCPRCLKHCVAVDDNPAFWRVPVFEFADAATAKRVKIQPRTVVHIDAYRKNMASKENDDCLYKLAKFLREHHRDI